MAHECKKERISASQIPYMAALSYCLSQNCFPEPIYRQLLLVALLLITEVNQILAAFSLL
jgi:hypothetical protein